MQSKTIVKLSAAIGLLSISTLALAANSCCGDLAACCEQLLRCCF